MTLYLVSVNVSYQLIQLKQIGRTKNNILHVWIVGNFHKRFMYQNGWMSRSQLPRTLTDTSLATWWPLIVAFPFSMAISGNWAHSCPPSVPTFKSDAFMFFFATSALPANGDPHGSSCITFQDLNSQGQKVPWYCHKVAPITSSNAFTTSSMIHQKCVWICKGMRWQNRHEKIQPLWQQHFAFCSSPYWDFPDWGSRKRMPSLGNTLACW